MLPEACADVMSFGDVAADCGGEAQQEEMADVLPEAGPSCSEDARPRSAMRVASTLRDERVLAEAGAPSREDTSWLVAESIRLDGIIGRKRREIDLLDPLAKGFGFELDLKQKELRAALRKSEDCDGLLMRMLAAQAHARELDVRMRGLEEAAPRQGRCGPQRRRRRR